MRRIFQIGFNKCGTTSFHVLFESSGYRSIHWDRGNLARTILSNANAHCPLLSGYEEYLCFFDMEWLADTAFLAIYATFYQRLDTEYPGSRFILNTRNIDDWIASRLRHKNFSDRFQRLYQQTKQQVVESWRSEWFHHHQAVTSYFAGRPESLLVYDIDRDTLEKLRVFLPEFHLVGERFPHENKSDW